MNRSRHLVVLFCLSASAGILPGVASAQSSAAVVPSTSFHGTNPPEPAEAAKEVMVTGTIEEVLSTHKQGTLRGTRLVLAGPQGIVNASVGPYLSDTVKAALTTGAQIQVAGINRTIHSENYLLVRELTVGNQKVTVRNEYGFLIHPRAEAGAHSHPSSSTTKGDNQ